jgi:phosphonatase-like hydrolase
MMKLIVFDMAGTTVDEDNVVYKTVRVAVNRAGYSYTQDQVQPVAAGKEKSQAIRDVLSLDGKKHDEAEVATIFADFRGLLAEAYATLDVREQPGAINVFETLKKQGVKVALNTGYDRPTAETLVAKLGWVEGRDFDVLVTASDVERSRPAPDMILRAMELTGVTSPSAVAKVGDSQIDIEEGKRAGCGWTFGVTTGAQDAALLRAAQPTDVIDSLDELLAWVSPGQQSTATV